MQRKSQSPLFIPEAERRFRREHLLVRLWQIAIGILAVAIVPLAVGLRSHTGKYILIAAGLLGISLVIMVVAIIIRGVEWIKKNVRVG
jgi:hypothetical protein